MSKFKLNWGWSILLVYATFVLVFLFYFFKSFHEAASNDLVVEDYYQKELVYGEVLDKKHHADTMRIPVKILNNEKGLTLQFPDYIDDKDVKGIITLYKPDNKKLDRETKFNLQNHQQILEKEKLIPGNWSIYLDWKLGDNPYYIEKKIYIK